MLVSTDSYRLVGSDMQGSRWAVSGHYHAFVVAGVMSGQKAKQSLLLVATSCSSVIYRAARSYIPE